MTDLPDLRADDVSVWPGVGDPVALLDAVTDWLTGYGNHTTRHTYAGQALGLPGADADITRWADAEHAPPGWSGAVRRYAVAMRRPATPGRPPTRRTSLPRTGGHLRQLHWFRWCAARDLDPTRARAAHGKQWLADLAAAGAAPATCDKMLGAVRALYDHLVTEDIAEHNPAALNRRRLGVVAPRGTATRTVTLTAAQVEALYHHAGRLPRQRELDRLRARAVIAVFLAGLRVGELCGLDRVDLHHNRGARALRVHGKGAKDRVVYLDPRTAAAVDDYLTAQDGAGIVPTGRAAGAHTPLLRNRNGHRCTRQAVWSLLRRVAAAADPGLADGMHPHALRHFYVTTAVERGHALADIAADVGHASVDTTRTTYNSAAPDPRRSAAGRVADAVFGAREDTEDG
ncbi:tyrosine-type recombinase/integrase [Actinokineospora enzanensis]|uniref:tyrosine-type recombinase/integrase n=1 Tax=Actinokineospora enzanensis TaxID=155975 RepID=UPI00036F183C|nr:tyrosine-type recombinase/integrase [Actinokineospora enzanensis]